MKAPVGSIVSLYYDSPRDLDIGQVLKTGTGRIYVIVELRKQAKGLHIGRWHIKAIVSDYVPEGAKVHMIYWYKREKRKK